MSEIKKEVREICTQRGLSPEQWRKASAKLERWQKQAYGAVDWDEHESESGLIGIVTAVMQYAKESEAGQYPTFNRGY